MALFRPRRNPIVDSTRVGRSLPWGYGQWVYPPAPSPQRRKGEVSVDEADMVSIPAIWAALRMLANLIASMPAVNADTKEPYTTGFYKDPCRDFGWYHLIQGCVMNIAVHGNAYWPIVDMDGRGRIRRVQPVHPYSVFIRRNDSGGVFEPYSLVYNISNVKYEQNEMVHFRGLMSGGYDLGLSPLRYLARALSRQISEEELSRNAFDDGGSPAAGYWTAPQTMDTQAVQSVANNIQASAVGGRGAGVLVVDRGLKYESGGMTMNELQMLEARQWSATEAAMMLGIPAHLIGAPSQDSETYTSVQQTLQGVTSLHLDFWRRCISDALNSFGMNVELSDAEILKPPIRERYEAYKTAIESGMLTVNEVRQLEALPPLPDAEADEARLANANPQPQVDPRPYAQLQGQPSPNGNGSKPKVSA